MKTTFTPNLLKPGYVCKLRNGEFVGVYNAIVGLFGGEGVCISGKKDWVPVEHYDENLNLTVFGMRDDEMDIMEVYGFAPPKFASHLSAEERLLLWKRPEEEKTEKSEEPTKHTKTTEPTQPTEPKKNRYAGLTDDEATKKFITDMKELGVSEEDAPDLAEFCKAMAGVVANGWSYGYWNND